MLPFAAPEMAASTAASKSCAKRKRNCERGGCIHARQLSNKADVLVEVALWLSFFFPFEGQLPVSALAFIVRSEIFVECSTFFL